MGLRSYYGGSLFAAPSFEPALGMFVRCVKLWAVPSRTIYPGSSSVFFARASDPWRLVAAVTGRRTHYRAHTREERSCPCCRKGVAPNPISRLTHL